MDAATHKSYELVFPTKHEVLQMPHQYKSSNFARRLHGLRLYLPEKEILFGWSEVTRRV